MSVGDAGEQRDHLVVAFKRVNIDGVTAARKWRQAGVANKTLDAGFREHVGQFLLRMRSGLMRKNASTSA